MAVVDEGRMALVGQLYTHMLEKRIFVDEERRTLWIIRRYDANIFANCEVSILNVNILAGEARGIVARYRADNNRFNVFCWYETEIRPFNLDDTRGLSPCFVLGRWAVNTRNENDCEIAMEAFGKAMSRRDIRISMMNTEEDRYSLARMLVMRANQGWLYCDMLFTRLWNSDLVVYFLDLEFLRECMLCGVRFEDPMKRKISVMVKFGN